MLICSWLIAVASAMTMSHAEEGLLAPTRSRLEAITSFMVCTLQQTDSVDEDEASLTRSRLPPPLALNLTKSLPGSRFVYYDKLQREVRAKTQAFNDGSWAESRVSYDAKGRKASTHATRAVGTVTTTYGYDDLNRVTTETLIGGSLGAFSIELLGVA